MVVPLVPLYMAGLPGLTVTSLRCRWAPLDTVSSAPFWCSTNTNASPVSVM